MDGDWKEVARLTHPPPTLHDIPTNPATLAFDSSQELLWTGNSYGRVSSFYGVELQRYTTFSAHPARDGPVHQLLFHEKGVIALGAHRIHMAMRRGLPIWNIKHEDFKQLRCMCFLSKDELLVAGCQEKMFVIDVVKGDITQEMQTSEEYTMMRRCRFICAATKSGSINIMDPKTFEVTKSWTAHYAGINDMDAQHDFIVTCGFSIRQGRPVLDPFINVFDLKQMHPLPPSPFPAGAAYVRMHPRMLTTSIAASQNGQLHVVDLMNPNTSNIRQVNVLGFLGTLAIAPSGEALAFAADQCDIHLWGSPARIKFAQISNPTEFTEPQEFPSLNDPEAPLNSIGMPYYREQLLSAWPTHLVSEVGAPSVKFDPQWLQTLKRDTIGLIGPNPKKNGRRNQVQNPRTKEKASQSLQTPKFLSEKARESTKLELNARRISDADVLGSAGLLSRQAEVPGIYQRIDIKYSKFGVEDFDFGYYNKTQYSGLETHIPNCYANSLLQILHATPLLRNAALNHAATNCLNDTCLLCQLGFLFDMLEKAEGTICQATNMLKTMNCHSQATTLKLIEEDSYDVPSTVMLQSLARFLLDRMVQDYRSIPSHAAVLEQTVTMPTTEAFRCLTCLNQRSKPSPIVINNLIYPQLSPSRNTRIPKMSFSQILKASIERDSSETGHCTMCGRYRPLQVRRTIHDVPPALLLNAAINSNEARQLWATPGWLPEEIGIIIDSGQFFCYQGKDLKTHLERGMHNIKVYSLIGFAADIDCGPHQKSHLVSLINVAHSMRSPPPESQWHLFNDFLVRPVSQEEALTFNAAWKLPSVIAYQHKTFNNFIDDSWKHNLDTSLLYQDRNNRKNVIKTYRPLHSKETPGPGTIVALDTEFVSVKQSEVEMNADGEQQTIRPMVYALARVSVVRGTGADEGEPLIDDYIMSREKIYDYLTSFSGIREGDLDPRHSAHNLVSLKVAYKKLWILLNLGCTFLGHGLKMDFRVANIQIPKSQVIDTSDAFYLEAKKRKLGLAFLAYILLKEDIQIETHDSIEDARTALKLYRKYLEFVDAGILEQMVEDVYARGREFGWKPPPAMKSDGELVERVDTPPIPPQNFGGAGVPSSTGPRTPVKKVGVGYGGVGAAGFQNQGFSGWSPSPLR